MHHGWCWLWRTHRQHAGAFRTVHGNIGRSCRLATRASRQKTSERSLSLASSLTVEQQQKLDQFHRNLQRAYFSHVNERERANIWQIYLELRSGGIAPLTFLSRAGWSRLWKLQLGKMPMHREHLDTLQMLLEDMKSVNITTSRYDQIIRIERFVLMQELGKAVQTWLSGPYRSDAKEDIEADGMVLTNSMHREASTDTELDQIQQKLLDKSFDQEWLQHGIRLFSLMGKMELVSAIATHLGHRLNRLDPQSAVCVVMALNDSRDDLQIAKAWNIFNTALRLPAHTWSFSELDSVCHSFLHAGSLPFASSVLQLMATESCGTHKQVRHVFGDLHKQIMDQVQTIDQADNISLELLNHLPDDPVQNYFFDTWLKASNRLGKPDHTSEIIELMFERGQSPQARHIDRLLGSWIDSSRLEKFKDVEHLALNMIKKNLDHTIEAEVSTVGTQSPSQRLPKFLKRVLPAADARTFVLLMKHYARSGDVDAAKQTLRLLNRTTNLTLDHQMARAILAIHFTMGDMQGAWQFFRLMRNDTGLGCDLRTAAVLWKGVNLHLVTNKTNNLGSFPGPRQLFNFMLRDVCKSADLNELLVRDSPSHTLYERVVHSFCLAEDTPGLLLALHSMKVVFNMHPTQKTVISVAQHIAHRRAWRLNADDRANTFQGNVQQQTLEAAAILQRLWKRMQDDEPSTRLLRYPGVFVKPKPSLKRKRRDLEQAKGEELLLLLTLFVKDYLLLNRNLGRRFGKAIDRAREDMRLTEYPEIDAKVMDLRSLSI